jgi:hypothetical protein
MAFLPEKNFFEETLASSYNLSLGQTVFPSSNILKFNILSLQFIYANVGGLNEFIIEQSNDSINWSELSSTYDIPTGTGNFIIDKGTFTGKYVRVNIVSATGGTLTIKVLAKR